MNQNYLNMRVREHNPGRSIGVFLIVFGLMMAAVIFDLLNLGDRDEYFRWQLLLIFIGLVSLFTRNMTGGLIMLSIGVYFLLPEMNCEMPYLVEKIYWPAAVVLLGLIMVVSGIVKRGVNK